MQINTESVFLFEGREKYFPHILGQAGEPLKNAFLYFTRISRTHQTQNIVGELQGKKIKHR